MGSEMCIRDSIEEDREDSLDKQIEEGEIKLEADLKRAEQFQAVAPNQPGQGGENAPSTGQSSEKKGPSEQEKTAQAAKVAQ